MRRRLDALTGVRFIAALLVFFFHFGGSVMQHTPTWLHNITRMGHLGVTLFFVLSGFILTYTYFPSGTSNNLNRSRFYWARFARLYPVFLLAFLLSAPLSLMQGYLHHGGISGALSVVGVGMLEVLGLQAWTPATACVWNCPAWSVSVEAFFYLTFPVLATFLLRLSTRRLLAVTLGALLVSAIPGLLLLLAPEVAQGTLSDWMYYTPALRLPEFMVGIATGRVFLQHLKSTRLSSAFTLNSLAVILIVMTLGPLGHRNALSPIVILAFAALIVGLASGRTWIADRLSSKLFIRLGEASYAFYILHSPLWEWAATVQKMLPGRDLPAPVFFWGMLAIVTVASLATFRFVEDPARRWLRDREGAWLPRRPSRVLLRGAEK
ncbi:acyltransferase family protein [Deinococcus yavapaiensis]|uniref:Peptidoglycan/LPS O-acetylase OafA/YrhL n=1 Tax=Deinococcus yavapaiensis KR-236 TaxID=694435 RepID=A0A318S462_9DEIO|nr:acyltransferase [Deinococcus yavapaiensis]PYE53199.1 peptidoglycan/LPS O-acetylase OafA/YrhL [Deinococcus yavapaiensis KR-236]